MDTIISTTHNIPIWEHNETERTIENAIAVLKAICVIRANNFDDEYMAETMKDKIDSEGGDIDATYRIAARMLTTWASIGADLYLGTLSTENYENEYFGGGMVGKEPVVTIFGEMFDSEGRTASVTITNNSIPSRVVEQIFYMRGFVDFIWESCGSAELERFGNLKHRTSNPTKSTKEKKIGKSNPFKKESTKEAAKATQKQVNEIRTVEELMALTDKTEFKMPVHKINIKPGLKSTIEFSGYSADIMNRLVPSEEKFKVWIKEDTDGYEQLKSKISSFFESNNLIASNEIMDDNYKFFITATKRISDGGVPYYRNITLEIINKHDVELAKQALNTTKPNEKRRL